MADTKSPVKYAIVDAFAHSAFRGNPAAVCLLEEHKQDCWLQAVAREFNQPVTCYLTRFTDPDPSAIPRFNLRWFSVLTEVNICGHATLAASHLCFTSGLVNRDVIEFSTLSGILTAKRVGKTAVKCVNGGAEPDFLIELDLPVVRLTDLDWNNISLVSEAFNDQNVVGIKGTAIQDDIVVELDSAEAVAKLHPKIDKIRKCPGRGMIVSSVAPPKSEFDFVSRFFFPKLGVDEDSFCGSAHCALASYWSEKLGKRDFLAYAASRRGGVARVEVDEDNNRVRLLGRAFTVMEGSLLV